MGDAYVDAGKRDDRHGNALRAEILLWGMFQRWTL